MVRTLVHSWLASCKHHLFACVQAIFVNGERLLERRTGMVNWKIKNASNCLQVRQAFESKGTSISACNHHRLLWNLETHKFKHVNRLEWAPVKLGIRNSRIRWPHFLLWFKVVVQTTKVARYFTENDWEHWKLENGIVRNLFVLIT